MSSCLDGLLERLDNLIEIQENYINKTNKLENIIIELMEVCEKGLMYSEDYLNLIGGPEEEKPMVENINHMKRTINKAKKLLKISNKEKLK